MDMQHQDPANWKFGILYYNPGDRRLILPKRNPAFGLTLNFANPYSTLIVALIILVVVAIIAL